MMPLVHPSSCFVALTACLCSAAFCVADEQTAATANSAVREFVSLEVYPPELTISSIRDSRRVIVTGVTADGQKIDVSGKTSVTTSSPVCSVAADGYIVPVAAGEGAILVEAVGQKKEVPVHVTSIEAVPVDFIRDVNPILSKVGCNQGTCHGSQAGKNGFKLSLRGYDSVYDYRALVDDISGRRFNRSEPSQSLMLLKPTQGVPHEGGFLFDEQSRYYQVLERWIAEGCQYQPDAPRVAGIAIYPPTPMLQLRHDQQQLIVIASYTDGSTRDVTREAVFETSNFEVATVSKQGLIKAVQRGEAAALVRFEGNYAAAPISILGNRSGYEWKPSPEHNLIDGFVNAKLQRMKLLPSGPADDAEFLRRASLDIAGVPPTIAEVKNFIADTTEPVAKRAAMVDQLLSRPEYVEHWTLKWSDLLLNRRKTVTERGVWAFRNWIRQGIATNKPYDQFAAELMTAGGSTLENPAANYFRIAREPKLVMENMTQVFLGTRFSCNQCHDHPFERWTQNQYYELAAYFADVGRRGLPNGDEFVFTNASPEAVINPSTNQPANPRFPFAHAGVVNPDAHRREQLSQWLTAKENPYFARSIVNRYWSYFLGRGIIDPVDDIRASNPASNSELLDALTKDFTDNGYDLKRLIRLICTSATYQRSLETNEWNDDDTINYSHAVPRRLSAEQLYDSIIQATGAPRALPGVPAGFRASELPDSQVEVAFLDMFGRPPRESPCECERTTDVSLGQTLNMVNGPTIGDAIAHPDGIIAKTLAAGATNEELIETIYLSTLCRKPSADEMAATLEYYKTVATPKEATEDLAWALINSPGFLFNR
ncbi:MAG: DUF1553 domain-containing protein [Planctomycetaceae bacterium]|nr:DUF1553 domain-containing protein [Planctomycetaceae bacterium]